MIDLRAQFKAERESLRIDLQDEETRAARKDRSARTPKRRPNPIKASAHSRSSSIAPATPVPMEMPSDQPAPSNYSLAGEGTQVVLMQLDQVPVEPLENSPTPKADIPLAPANANATLLASIAELLKPINERLEMLEATEQYRTNHEGRIHANRNFEHIDSFDYDFYNDIHEKRLAGWHIEHPREKFEDYFDLADMQDAKAWEEYAMAANEIPEKDEAGMYPFNPDAFAGDRPSQPIVVDDPTPPAVTKPSHDLSHLVPNQGRAPIPSLICRANPRQVNSLPTIGGSSYANRAARSPTTPPPRPRTNNPAKPQPYTEAQLRSRTTTKAHIVQNARDALGIHLSITKPKPELIQSFLNADANNRMPGYTSPNPPQVPQQSRNERARQANQNRVTSDWNVRRIQGTESIEFKKPFNGNAYTMIKAIEVCLHQATGESEPPLTLLAGKWWSPLSSNFTITLAGNLSIETVRKYREAILKPFGENIFNLVPNQGQTRLAFQNVPILRKSDGSLPSSNELKVELGRNLQYRSCAVIEGPIWTKATLEDPTKTVGAFTILLSDPNRKLGGIIRKPVYMFGDRLTVNFASRFTPFKQCARCHVLTHSTDECRRPKEYIRCHICGQPRHTAKDHATKCPDAKKHTSLLCDCPIKCFNCVYAGKLGTSHIATDDYCPLKKNMRHTSPTPPPQAGPDPLVSTPAPPNRVDDL